MATPAIPTRAIIPFLVAMMLFTGVCNTLLTKYQVGVRRIYARALVLTHQSINRPARTELTAGPFPFLFPRTSNVCATAPTRTPKSGATSSSP